MVIDRAAVERRLAILRREQAQVRANLDAYAGAIEDCLYWLDVLSAREAGEAGEVAEVAGKAETEG